LGGSREEKERKAQVYRAAEALWGYIVQREALGLTDHTKVTETFGITPEVWCEDEMKPTVPPNQALQPTHPLRCAPRVFPRALRALGAAERRR
jgi:hypothetical protein